MKKNWMKPEAIVEEFAANEYVAACWGIRCLVHDTMGGRDGFGTDLGGHRNSSGTCGALGSQYVQEAGGDNYKITEFNRTFGEMPCTIYPEGFDYTNHVVNGTGVSKIEITTEMMKQGDITLYWTTESDRYKYYHYGVVDFTGNTAQHS